MTQYYNVLNSTLGITKFEAFLYDLSLNYLLRKIENRANY